MVAGLYTSKGHGCPVRKTESKYGRRNVRTKRNDSCVPSYLHACFEALFNHGPAVMVRRAEDI